MRVLIGVDGSPGSLAAVAMAGRLLAEKDEIAFYYSPVEVTFHGDATTSHDMLERARQALGNAVFDESRKHLPGPLAGKAETILGTQTANRGLAAAALEWRADIVCVGSRGLGPVKTLLLGSVANAIVRAVHVPVLVVRPAERPAQRGMRLLLGYDEANCDRQATVLGWFAWPPGSSGQVIAAIDALPTFPTWLEQRARSADAEAIAKVFAHEHEEEIQRLRQKLNEFIRRLPPIFHGSEPIVAEGYPTEEILRTAAENHVDLIVVGKSSKSFYQRFALGSTSETVLHHAHCSVLVVPMGEHP